MFTNTAHFARESSCARAAISSMDMRRPTNVFLDLRELFRRLPRIVRMELEREVIASTASRAGDYDQAAKSISYTRAFGSYRPREKSRSSPLSTFASAAATAAERDAPASQ